MIIGKLVKPYKMCFFESKVDGSELESFSLLKLSFFEFTALLEMAVKTDHTINYGLNNVFTIEYKGDDKLHKLWKSLACQHEAIAVEPFYYVNAKFPTVIGGTSCLIRDPEKHSICIAYRKSNQDTSINRLCICNSIRERFFSDCKTSTLFKTTKKYAIDSRDKELYSYWSKYMNDSFIRQHKDYRKTKLK